MSIIELDQLNYSTKHIYPLSRHPQFIEFSVIRFNNEKYTNYLLADIIKYDQEYMLSLYLDIDRFVNLINIVYYPVRIIRDLFWNKYKNRGITNLLDLYRNFYETQMLFINCTKNITESSEPLKLSKITLDKIKLLHTYFTGNEQSYSGTLIENIIYDIFNKNTQNFDNLYKQSAKRDNIELSTMDIDVIKSFYYDAEKHIIRDFTELLNNLNPTSVNVKLSVNDMTIGCIDILVNDTIYDIKVTNNVNKTKYVMQLYSYYSCMKYLNKPVNSRAGIIDLYSNKIIYYDLSGINIDNYIHDYILTSNCLLHGRYIFDECRF